MHCKRNTSKMAATLLPHESPLNHRSSCGYNTRLDWRILTLTCHHYCIYYHNQTNASQLTVIIESQISHWRGMLSQAIWARFLDNSVCIPSHMEQWEHSALECFSHDSQLLLGLKLVWQRSYMFQHPCLYRTLLQEDWFVNNVESVNNILRNVVRFKHHSMMAGPFLIYPT